MQWEQHRNTIQYNKWEVTTVHAAQESEVEALVWHICHITNTNK